MAVRLSCGQGGGATRQASAGGAGALSRRAGGGGGGVSGRLREAHALARKNRKLPDGTNVQGRRDHYQRGRGSRRGWILLHHPKWSGQVHQGWGRGVPAP
eukprot:5225007-Prymnesium_polylepis.2